jgi:hypothetical protein
MKKQTDPYLRNISEIEIPIGMTALDAAQRTPGPSLIRFYETVADKEQQDYPRLQNYILARGAAVGVDESGRCCHFWAGRELRFVGFLEGQAERRAVVKTRGSIVLHIAGVQDADRLKPVYCHGPNDFSLDKLPGAAEIGKIRYVQNGRAAVAFRREGDDRPLNLDVR